MIIIITDWPKSLLGDCDLKYNYAIYSLLRKDFEPFPDWGEDIIGEIEIMENCGNGQ